jgi:hypothetical protein
MPTFRNRTTGTLENAIEGLAGNAEGVLGVSSSRNGVVGEGLIGVSGSSQNIGVVGRSVDGVGVYGEGSTAVHGEGSQTGVIGVSHVAGGIGVIGQSIDGVAAMFFGNVQILHGGLQVSGPKSALVPHRDGTHRQLYCMESPESWFEDFGETSLHNGVRKVKLDRDFAALVHTTKYQVFLSSYDRVQLYVSKRTREGFEIRAMPDAAGKIPKKVRCGYRIVARRKDITVPRLAKIKIPAIPKRPAFPKFLKSLVHLSKKTHDQFAALRKTHRKRLREVKRFTATAAKRDHK